MPDHGDFSPTRATRSGERARFVGLFQGCTGLWTAGCWLARRLHQLRASTTMDLGISILLISVQCVVLRNLDLLIKTGWSVIFRFFFKHTNQTHANRTRANKHAQTQTHTQKKAVFSMHQEVLPGALRPAESTVETQGSTVESGGDGGPNIRMHDVGPPPRPLPVTEEDTPPTTPASYRVPPRARHLPTAFVRSGPQEDWVPKRGSYHSTTATSVRGSHGQTTRRAPPEAADGRKTRRGGRSRQGTPGAELDGLSQGRLPSVRSHRRLYGGQPAHIRS